MAVGVVQQVWQINFHKRRAGHNVNTGGVPSVDVGSTEIPIRKRSKSHVKLQTIPHYTSIDPFRFRHTAVGDHLVELRS